MPKEKILIIKAHYTQLESLEPLWFALGKKHFDILRLESKCIKNCQPDAIKWWQTLSYYLLLPLTITRTFFELVIIKPNIVITSNLGDLLVASLTRAFIEYKIGHLLLPESEASFIRLRFLKGLFKAATIFVFSSGAKSKLLQQNYKNNLLLLLPGLEPKSHSRQENIFNSLARTDHFKRKFFTIGTITDINSGLHLESLLKATKEIVELIPNLQLIVIGDGQEKKNLQWMSRQLNVESFVWFVGQTDQPSKWLENLDLYIVTKPHLRLSEQTFALEIMQRGIPLIADISSGLDDIIHEGKTGKMINFQHANSIAETIISLEQDRKALDKMRHDSSARAENLFSVEKQLDQFAKLL